MKSILLIVALCFFFCGCQNTRQNDNAYILSEIKKNIDNEKCFDDDHSKFVSLVFFKTENKSLVHVCTYLDRPYNDNNVFYYREDSDYLFVCAGYCDEFVKKYQFKKWNDSIDNHYRKFWYLMENSPKDRAYYLKHNNFDSSFYEYDGDCFVHLDSLTYEEQFSILNQLVQFDLGYCIAPPPPLP